MKSVPLPLQNSCITLPQQSPILHNRKKHFDRVSKGLCTHAWCFRQGSMKSDPQVNDIPIPLKVPSGLPCLNMQNRLIPAKWPVTHMSACVCIFIPLSLEVCNICLFKMPVPSGWEVAVLKQDQVLQGQRICFIMSIMCIFIGINLKATISFLFVMHIKTIWAIIQYLNNIIISYTLQLVCNIFPA